LRFRRPFALLCFPLAVAIWIAISSRQNLLQYRSRLEEIDRTYRFLVSGQYLFGRLRDAESGQRGYLLTGREVYLVPYQRALANIEIDLHQMETSVGGVGIDSQRVARLRPLIAEKHAELAQTLDLYRTQGRGAAIRLVDTDRGLKLMEEIRTGLNSVLIDSLRLLVAQRKAGDAATARASLNTAIGSTVLFILLLGAAVIIERDSAQIAKLNSTLENKIQERTRALSDSNRELEAFCYTVSHDLRAPLRGVDGFAKMLWRDHADSFDAPARDLLQRIRNSTARMGELIEDLLNLSRISRTEFEPQPVDLSTLAQSVVGDIQSREPGRVVEISVESGLTAVGDSRLLRVALENLLDNAWKFTRKQSAAAITIGASMAGGERVFFVRDNGAGFDMKQAGQLFIPFQRLHKAAEFEGSGVGLATVERVVARHGGRVWGESAPGQGACFFFTLASRR
jgi:signal transduction histidine kinase